MSEWCQNKDCCYKRNQNQMRGSKGNKYYQSNKSNKYYYDMFCSQGCFHSWFGTNKETLLNTIGTIGKQTIGVDDAWEFKHEYNYNNSGSNDNYFLINYLTHINIIINMLNPCLTTFQRNRPSEESEFPGSRPNC